MTQTFRVAAVAIVKDEARYLPEWLAYHIELGCEHFFIFDNGSADESRKILEPFINYGYVTLVEWPLFPGQLDAYNYAARVFGPLTEWLTFIDVDEFYVLKQHSSLPELLADIDADQLLVFWKTFGHSGHRERPEGLVIENYLACEAGLSPVTKAIVRSNQIQVVYVHNCVTTTGRTVNDAGQPLREDWMHPEPKRTEELVRINHYFTRSYEDYQEKIGRGQVDGRNQKRLEPFDAWDFEKKDRAAADRAANVERWLARFARLPAQPHRYGAATAIGSVSEPRNFKLYAESEARLVVKELVDAGGAIDHFRFGVAVHFDDCGVAAQLNAVIGERLERWANATHGQVLAGLHVPGSPSVVFNNGQAVRRKDRLELEAATEDPQIVVDLASASQLGYHWLVAALVVPVDTEADVFAFGLDPQGAEARETRRLPLRAGLSLVMVMINDLPLRLTRGRLDPGSTAGRYELWNLGLVRSS